MNACKKWLLAGLLLGFGCTGSPTEGDSVEAVFFPRQNFAPNAYMEALLEGTLVVKDGCLRVDGVYTDIVPVWPLGFTLQRAGVRLVVVGNALQPGVRLGVGSEVRMGGGYVPHEAVETFVDAPTWQALQQRCPGEYFIVGAVATR